MIPLFSSPPSSSSTSSPSFSTGLQQRNAPSNSILSNYIRCCILRSNPYSLISVFGFALSLQLQLLLNVSIESQRCFLIQVRVRVVFNCSCCSFGSLQGEKKTSFFFAQYLTAAANIKRGKPCRIQKVQKDKQCHLCPLIGLLGLFGPCWFAVGLNNLLPRQ